MTSKIVSWEPRHNQYLIDKPCVARRAPSLLFASSDLMLYHVNGSVSIPPAFPVPNFASCLHFIGIVPNLNSKEVDSAADM